LYQACGGLIGDDHSFGKLLKDVEAKIVDDFGNNLMAPCEG
jgi:hypothetical protein